MTIGESEITYIPPDIKGNVPEDVMADARLLAKGNATWKVEIIHRSPGKYEVKEYHNIDPFITPKEVK